MAICSHANCGPSTGRGCGKKKMGMFNRNTISTHRRYIRIYPIFIREVPFNPFWNHFIKPTKSLLNKIFMSKKYIQDSMMLTKEAFEQYIQQQREAQAAQYGLTLEEYNQAIMNGDVVQAKSPSDLPPKQ
jgi:hypothetical protein